jgi:hypothetical protein
MEVPAADGASVAESGQHTPVLYSTGQRKRAALFIVTDGI